VSIAPLAIATAEIVLLVVLVIVGALVAGGYAAAARRAREGEHELLTQLQAAESALTQARVSDRGWDRALLESAARTAASERFGAVPIKALQLVQVIDRPGTEADQAIFRVQTADGEEHRITLGRSGGVWGTA
jgi:hypothetical protein